VADECGYSYVDVEEEKESKKEKKTVPICFESNIKILEANIVIFLINSDKKIQPPLNLIDTPPPNNA
jgi:hypothetical protein